MDSSKIPLGKRDKNAPLPDKRKFQPKQYPVYQNKKPSISTTPTEISSTVTLFDTSIPSNEIKLIFYAIFFLGFFLAILLGYCFCQLELTRSDDPVILSLHEVKLAQELASNWSRNTNLTLYSQWISQHHPEHGFFRHKLDFAANPRYKFHNPDLGESLLASFDITHGLVQFFVATPNDSTCQYLSYCTQTRRKINSVVQEQELGIALFGKLEGELAAWQMFSQYVYRPLLIWIISLSCYGLYLLASLIFSDRMFNASNLNPHCWGGKRNNRRNKR